MRRHTVAMCGGSTAHSGMAAGWPCQPQYPIPPVPPSITCWRESRDRHVAIKVEDIAASGYAADRATVRQKKTGRSVRFELSEQTRQAVDDYLKVANKRPGEFLFSGRRGVERSMTTRQYARLVSEWIGSVGFTARTTALLSKGAFGQKGGLPGSCVMSVPG